jgi:hypothetical protein
LNDAVPIALDDILEKMLARDPRDRYQTASELIVDLERSGLSAQVPSFIDRDLAMLDPLVRQRITTPAQATAPDLQMPGASSVAEPPAELWYVRYRDRHGQLCKAKSTAEQIRRRLKEGRLPLQAQAATQPHGTYLPIGDLPEFREVVESQLRLRAQRPNGSARAQGRDILADTVAEPASTGSSRWLILAGVGICAAVAIVALVLVLLAG